MKSVPCSTSTVASGRPMRRWIRPPEASMPPSRIGDRNDRQRIVPGEEGDEDAGVTIARGKRGIGAALHGGHLDHAGKACKTAGDRREADDQPADRQTLDLCGANIAAGDTGREAVARHLDQHPGERCRRRRRSTRPQCTSMPGMLPSMYSGGSGVRRRFVRGSPDRAAVLRRTGSSARWRYRRAAARRSSR